MLWRARKNVLDTPHGIGVDNVDAGRREHGRSARPIRQLAHVVNHGWCLEALVAKGPIIGEARSLTLDYALVMMMLLLCGVGTTIMTRVVLITAATVLS